MNRKLLLLILPVLLVACNESSSKKEEKNTVSSISGSEAAAKDTRPKIWFDETYVKFYLRETGGLTFVPIDSLPWANTIQRLPQNGPIAYFFMDPEDVALSAPHARIEYVYRRQPWCSTSDSLYLWTQSVFMERRNGELTIPKSEIDTYSGKKAAFWTIRTPDFEDLESGQKYSGKWMSWAYVPQDDYYVGFVFTSLDSASHETGVIQFRNLIRTYEEKKG